MYVLTFSLVAASTCTPAELSNNRTTFSLPLYAARCSGVKPDSAPSIGTNDTPVGGSDFTVPGTYDKSSRTVSVTLKMILLVFSLIKIIN